MQPTPVPRERSKALGSTPQSGEQRSLAGGALRAGPPDLAERMKLLGSWPFVVNLDLGEREETMSTNVVHSTPRPLKISTPVLGMKYLLARGFVMSRIWFVSKAENTFPFVLCSQVCNCPETN